MSYHGNGLLFAGLLSKALSVTIPNFRWSLGLVTVFCKDRKDCNHTKNSCEDEGGCLGDAATCQERSRVAGTGGAGKILFWVPQRDAWSCGFLTFGLPVLGTIAQKVSITLRPLPHSFVLDGQK